MIKNINVKKIFSVMSVGFVLLSSGCGSKKIIIITEKPVETDISNSDDINTTEIIENVETTEITSEEVTTSTIIEEKTEENNVNNVEEVYTEQNVIDEFIDMQTSINSSIVEGGSNILDKIGDKVATMIGFIWYGEEIKGYTFNDLTDSAKEKILNIYYVVDGKIENKFPNYKESIKEKYTVVSSFIKDKFDDLKYSVDSWLAEKIGEEKYSEIKDDVKEVVSTSLDDVKEVTGYTKEKIKEWYQKKKSE